MHGSPSNVDNPMSGAMIMPLLHFIQSRHRQALRLACSFLVCVLCGCYHLMAGSVREGIAATDEALRAGRADVAQAYIAPTREIAGEPKSIPPLSLGAAELWGRQVRAKAARLRASLASFLSRFGLQTALGGSGIMAFLVGWVVKNKRTVSRLTHYAVEQGRQRLEAAKTPKDEAAVLKSLKGDQEKYAVRKPIRNEVKKNGKS